MGSTTHIVDEAGAAQNRYEYDAWGNLTAQEEAVPNRFKYTGQQFDPVTQQYYLRARFYNPVIARFTQEDTYRGDGLNLYAYCANNPVLYVDPSGNVSQCVKDAYYKRREEGLSAVEAYKVAKKDVLKHKYDAYRTKGYTAAESYELATGKYPLVPEVFYRTMSQEQYDILRMTGEVQPTGETFISPTRNFSEDYDGVTIRLEVRQGTTKKLTEIGVSDGSRQAVRDYGRMPACFKGWGTDHAYFKGEGSQTNIGLGQGKAREIFNQNLIRFQKIGG